MNKSEARKYCFHRIKNIENKKIRDEQISLFIQKEIKKHKIIWIYKPIKNEIILDLNLDGVVVSYPKIILNKIKFYTAEFWFEIKSFKIPEPIIKTQKEVIPELLIIPCVWYYKNYRLGYWKWLYDRYLSEHPQITTIWVVYKDCKLENLEVEKFDIKLWKIIKI